MKAQCIILIICVTWCSAQFIDDMQEMFDLPCLEDDMFLCMDGGCIEQAQYCDGISHCDDNSDESMCLFSQNDIVACNVTHQFECRDNKRCIPRAWICNNETDCDDGSDEVNCTVTLPEITNSTCKGFKCLDGKCISYLWLCDGVYDCNDRSDENAEELCRHLRYPHAIPRRFRTATSCPPSARGTTSVWTPRTACPASSCVTALRTAETAVMKDPFVRTGPPCAQTTSAPATTRNALQTATGPPACACPRSP
ncbi:low-density lipoprotein receptor-like [Trichoplusia ni]|uniref:Low-density lipoprotein receptor-like n=1 Tax=Trichoplusia ni TaxID=7111 RepID=A0A7E5WXG2_TRINI|nr:low-density lipoprotein receptor-like [Trichoplusia ni]